MAKNKSLQKLELTWIGKQQEHQLEPRILLQKPEHSYGKQDTENMIIKGDNLLALKALEQDYSNKIKCIYIDPPYNTGNAFEHYDDGIEHSLWLQLMAQRLKMLHKLLADDGSIFISIDDAEQAFLTLLCHEIFGRDNFIACLPTIMNLKGNQDQFGFAGTHEYTIVFAKNKTKLKFNEFLIDEEGLEDWEEDEMGAYKKGANLKATGTNAPREKRPNLYFPIYITKEGDFYLDRKNNDDTEILPITDGKEMSWRWGKNKFNTEKYNVIITGTNGQYSLYKKQRPEIGELPSKKPKSLFYKPEYSSGNGTSQIKKIFGHKAFDYPKPEDLIKDILLIATNAGDLVLDSFLGSGTTAAVAHKMGRHYIGIELGEHAYTHCVPRMQAVVQGEQGGISKSVGWKGGGGFKFYELAPSLLQKDAFDMWIINPEYNPDMLAAAMAKQEGYKYAPDAHIYWKQGQAAENSYIFTTTQFVTVEMLDIIIVQMQVNESLVICCKSFQAECMHKFANIHIKKIPVMLLDRCQFGIKDEYSLNVINIPNYLEEDKEEDNILYKESLKEGKKKKPKIDETQQGLF